MDKTKVLQVVNIPFVLPYYFGDQIVFLKNNGIDVSIACSQAKELTQFCEKYEVVEYPIDILRKIDIITDLKSLIKLIKIIKKEKFEYVIGHTPKGALLSMLAARLVGVKHRIYFRHGIVFETSTGFKKKLMIFLEKLTSRCATKIISVSNSVQVYSIKTNINSSTKSFILNKGTCNGVDLTRFVKGDSLDLRLQFGIDQNSFVVGYVGRLVNDKGINELIEAWQIVKEKIINCKLLLVGPFEERDSLTDSIKEVILTDKTIIFTNLVENTVPYYNLMDVFILPSYREGFPTVVLEASAMELPVITTKNTGCVDSIVENITGRYTTLDPIEIAENIVYYFENDYVKKKHGKEGREWVSENFNQQVVWNSILKTIFNKF